MAKEKPAGAAPPMGWNSWNTFTWDISEKLIRETADALASGGYRDAGYEYIVIDDCWSLKERDRAGRLVPDPDKFPSGMRALADYVHARGLKFGMYACVGTHTCAGYPGSFEHEFEDAALFASWGVDFLKYDYCYKPKQISGELLYKRMGLALGNSGRDILLSACSWGEDSVFRWARETGASMFRSTGDIQDSWDSVRKIALSQLDKTCFSGAYCHNDMDMLVVGMYGGSNSGFIGGAGGGCTDTEYRTHFSLWCMMGSPLMIGCDVRTANAAARDILLNRDLIAINQDPACRAAYRVETPWSGPEEAVILVKALTGGALAVGLFNLGDGDREMSLPFWDVGLPAASGMGMAVYDCWAHRALGVFHERYRAFVPAHGCMVVRMKPDV